MKSTFLLIITICIAITANAQKYQSPFTQTGMYIADTLYGPVQTISEHQSINKTDAHKGPVYSKITLNKDGNMTEGIIYDSTKKIIDEAKFEYQDKLLKTMNQVRHENIKTHQASSTIIIDYQYNEKKLLVKKLTNKENEVDELSYTPDGKLAKTFSSQYPGCKVYSYDPQGKWMSVAQYDDYEQTNLYMTQYFTYDNNKNLTAEKWVENERTVLYVQLMYDTNQNIIQITDTRVFGNDTKSISTLKYEYDSHKNIIKLQSFNDNATEPKAIVIFEYKYDSHNNWTEQTMIRNNVIVRKIIREIAYYE